MKKISTLLLGACSLTSAQLNYQNGSFLCPLGSRAFCAGDSLSTNIIVRCIGKAGIAGNCNDNLAGVPPVGVKTSASCYQSSTTAGDAACSFNGTVYPDGSSPFPIPSGTSKSFSGPTSTGSSGLGGSSMTTVTTTMIETGITKTVTTTVPCSTSTSSTVVTTTVIASQPSGVLPPPYSSHFSGPLPPYPSTNITTSTVPIISVPGTGTVNTSSPTTSAYTYPLLPPPSSSYVSSSLSSSYPPLSPSTPTSSPGTPPGSSGTTGSTSASTVAPSSGAMSVTGDSSEATYFAGLLFVLGVFTLVEW